MSDVVMESSADSAHGVGERISKAREAVGLSQRDLQQKTGISQSTLCRIESGVRAPKMNEVLAIAWAVGCVVSELTGHSAVRDRVECVVRASNNATMDGMQRELTYYLEFDAYLESQGVPQPI